MFNSEMLVCRRPFGKKTHNVLSMAIEFDDCLITLITWLLKMAHLQIVCSLMISDLRVENGDFPQLLR